jgi:hypothetical protein
VDQGDFSHPEDAVPPAVYLPDGHKVPICVVLADRDNARPEGAANFNFPANTIGGGYPVTCDVQGREHVASIGCLVTDGHRTYALTNRHVAGEAGSPIYSIIGGNKVEIGRSAPLQLNRQLFTKLYPEWPGKNVYVDLDVGLIDMTTSIAGPRRYTGWVRLVNSRTWTHPTSPCGSLAVRCVHSAQLPGRWPARSVRCFIDSSRSLSLGTHPGDSGTLWVIDDQRPGSPKSRPIALQWGGQIFMDQSTQGSSYALATLLTTVCNELDVTLLRDWNTGLPEYWGAVGHYSIATKAIGVIRNENLKRLMDANLARISFNMSDINKKNMQGLSKRDFVPLADVPDMVWKIGPYRRGGMTSPEHANHFANMDRRLKQPLPQGATLLDICKNKPNNVNVALWQQYYNAVKAAIPI